MESLACVNRGGVQVVHKVDDGLQLVELGRQRLGRVDTLVIYRSTLLVWVWVLSFRRSASLKEIFYFWFDFFLVNRCSLDQEGL